MEMMPDFASIIKQARTEANLSQEDLAHALNVSYVTINRWENGKSKPSKLAQTVFLGWAQEKGIRLSGLAGGGKG
jgi:DNA-binding transcriptional regulator YiaG